MAQFRETMWFKLGEEPADTGEEAVMPLPIEDRYHGGVSAEDSRAFGLHTGTTEYLPVVADRPTDDVTMRSLVGEMKVSKKGIILAAASLAAVCSMFVLYVV